MALLEAAALIASKRLPKTIGPKLHAAIDYSNAAVFFVAAALFWKRNKRAAQTALAGGSALVVLSMLTDYKAGGTPGGLKKSIGFEMHGRIDAGFAGMLAGMPKFLGFGGEPEARFFRAEAIAESVLYGLTDFEAGSSNRATGNKAA